MYKPCGVYRLKMGAMSYLEGNVRGEFNKAVALSTSCKMLVYSTKMLSMGETRSQIYERHQDKAILQLSFLDKTCVYIQVLVREL
jgi:hypothetical protein